MDVKMYRSRARRSLSFTVGYSDNINEGPAEVYEAVVPGAVQLDYQRAKNLPDYWYSQNFKEYSFAEDKYWHYISKVDINCKENMVPYLYFAGIDYEFDILINQSIKLHRAGLYTPVRLDVSEYVNQTIDVEVIVYPVPRNPVIQIDSGNYRPKSWDPCNTCKPNVSYGGDWHPPLVPLGLHDEAYVEYASHTHFKSVEMQSYVPETLDEAQISLDIAVVNPKGSIELHLCELNGPEVYHAQIDSAAELNHKFVLKNPKLWWCVKQGEQNRYELIAELKDENGNVVDRFDQKTGFKRIRLLINAGSYQIPQVFPCTQAENPNTFELNGRRIFAKGSNWVPNEIFPGLYTEKKYRELVGDAAEANMNILRMWGGGYINRDSFFDICDETGIMVWQEFPLACAPFPDLESYLEVLDQESKTLIKKFRNHPSLVMWCGGNELFNHWSGMTDQSHALRLLDKNTYELDRHKPYIFTSPRYSVGHGNYILRYPDGREMLPLYVADRQTAYCEFGVPGPSSVEYLKSIMTEEEYADFSPDNSWGSHHAFNAWAYEDDWFRTTEIRYFYGQENSFEELVENGIDLQMQAYKHIFEEFRRQWPHCSVAINWCYNEPWPTAAGNSLIGWPNVKKKSYYGVQSALRDQMLSIRVNKLGWKTNETVTAELFVLNDLPQPLKGGKATMGYRTKDDKTVEIGEFEFDVVDPLSNRSIATVDFALDGISGNWITIFVTCDNADLNNEYKIYIVE
jgi:beta-mannosidase